MTSKPRKVAFYADIFYNSPLSPPYWIPPRDLDVEAILLGGDIHYRPDGLGEMLREIRATQHDATWLIVVPGNGEYAHQELGESRRQYREAVESVPGAVFLDDHAEGLQGVDDIRVGDRFLTLRDTNELHRAARSFLAGELRSLSETERGQTIVCTHFWPTLRPFAGRPGVPDEEWYQVFGSDLDSLITECGPRIWLCGHVHITHDVTIGSTLVSSNPRAGDGSQIINPDFRESYVVEL